MHVREIREQTFWDEHVPSLAKCLRQFECGPSGNVRTALRRISPVTGRRVLDFACGAGVLSAWLAERGASVTGLDISPLSLARARELTRGLGLSASFTTGPLDTLTTNSFDAIIGEYALHHVDLDVIAPELCRVLKPGGVGAFVETMALNPLLNFARAWLCGRGPVARFGSDDERPINVGDLYNMSALFGDVTVETGEMQFLRILDRNVFKYRRPAVSHLFGRADDWLLERGRTRLSYHQVVVVTKAYHPRPEHSVPMVRWLGPVPSDACVDV